MILPDVNPLIYAFRTDAPHHVVSRRWLTSVLSGDGAFGVSPVALAAVVRITTNRSAFPDPSRPEEAFQFCDYLRAHPEERGRYAAGKREAFASGATTLLSYSDAKAALVEGLLERARRWAPG